MFDWLVVGAGFAGSVLAERLASQRGERVMVVDRRPHIAGNAYDHPDAAGVLMHRYGPHIFRGRTIRPPQWDTLSAPLSLNTHLKAPHRRSLQHGRLALPISRQPQGR